MSLAIRCSFIENFKFNGEEVRSLYVADVGQCLVATDVYRVVWYDGEDGKKAMQRVVPEKYKMRAGDVIKRMEKGDISVPLHPDTVT